MKFSRIIPLLLVTLLFFSACAPKEEKLDLEFKEIKFAAELTRDDQNEGIITKISEGSEPSSVTVYYKMKDKWYSMYQAEVGTEDEDQCGLYVCKKGGRSCLINWSPTIEKDKTTLSYQIFYLRYDVTNKCGRMVVVEEDSVTFTKGQVSKDGDKYNEAHKFVTKLNKYLKKSIALIDTVGGDVIYSTNAKSRTYKLYEPSWLDSSYKDTTTSSSNIDRVGAKTEVDTTTASDNVLDADRYKTEDTTPLTDTVSSEE